MRAADIIRRAGMNLRQAKMRTVLTSLAIAVGAFTIALAMAAGNGGRSFTEEMVHTSGDMYSLSVYPRIEQEVSADKLPEYGVEASEGESVGTGRGGLTDRDIERLQKVNGVESVRPMLYVESEYMTRGEGYKKRVASLSTKDDRTEMKLAAGSLDDFMLHAGEAIVPEGYLESFGFESAEDAIGKTLYVHIAKVDEEGMESVKPHGFPLTVVAVDRPSDTVLYYQEAVRVSPEDIQAMYGYRYGSEAAQRYHGATVLVERDRDVATVQQTVRDIGYEAYSLEDMREQLLQTISVAQYGLMGFGALAILASVFGIINTQYISVLERTQQIGLMKALGMRSKDISRLFRYEAAWIGFLGGMMGVVLAFLVTLLNPFIADFLSLEEGTKLLKMDWLMSGVLIASLMLVAILSGWFPSRKAAKLDPIEALRTE